jgi:hypothetical protein
MVDIPEPENLCHLLSAAYEGKLPMTMCGMPGKECHWHVTSREIFQNLDMQDQCVLCEIELKRLQA